MVGTALIAPFFAAQASPVVANEKFDVLPIVASSCDGGAWTRSDDLQLHGFVHPTGAYSCRPAIGETAFIEISLADSPSTIRMFRVDVGVADDSTCIDESIRFRAVGDGVELGTAVARYGGMKQIQSFIIGVDTLRLEATSVSGLGCATAALASPSVYEYTGQYERHYPVPPEPGRTLRAADAVTAVCPVAGWVDVGGEATCSVAGSGQARLDVLLGRNHLDADIEIEVRTPAMSAGGSADVTVAIDGVVAVEEPVAVRTPRSLTVPTEHALRMSITVDVEGVPAGTTVAVAGTLTSPIAMFAFTDLANRLWAVTAGYDQTTGLTRLANGIRDFEMTSHEFVAIDISSRLWRKSGSMDAPWQLIARGARQVALSETGRIAMVDGASRLWVLEPTPAATWEYVTSGVVDVALSGDRMVVINRAAHAWALDGDLTAPFVHLAGGAQDIAVTAHRVGLIDSAGHAWATEGQLGGPFVLLTDHATSIAMDGTRIGVTRRFVNPYGFRGESLAKAGPLTAGWRPIPEGRGLKPIEFSRDRIATGGGLVKVIFGPTSSYPTFFFSAVGEFELF